MTAQALLSEMSRFFEIPKNDVRRLSMLALIEKETRLAEAEIAAIGERYAVHSQESLYDAIRDGIVPGHPAWEDYIVWKNRQTLIEQLLAMLER